ncbi:MAG TPA: hypothetical protein VM253_05275 [Candidatus Limnocylindrales bacterium]|nr:hypothetical protein [Candidatus Limnocylindrales bacterium]
MDDVGKLERMLRLKLIGPDGGVDGEGFTVDTRLEAAADGLVDLAAEVRFHGQRPVDRGVRIALELPAAEEAPQWLVPGLFYGENRPVACRRRYPRYERGVRDPDRMTCETWSFRVDRAATPAVFGWSGGRMAMLAVDERSPIGPAGIGFVGSAEHVAIWVDLPYREEPIAYRGYDRPDAPDVLTHAWQPGESVTLRARLALGDGDRHGYAPLLRALHARTAGRPRPWVDVADAAALAADGLLRWHYHPEHRALYETASFERELDGSAGGAGDRPHMHTGWVSGVPWAAQLLAWGRRIASDAHVAAGLDVLDMIAENLSPSGTFWAAWTLERGWGTGWSPKGSIHANTIGQATLFFLRALATEDAGGVAHPAWEAAVRSNLDAVVRRQREDGNLGTYHDAETGTVTEWEGAGAQIWIAALLDGADRFDEERYREAAAGAGAYYRRFVDEELIYGAPEDVHLAPTSEDGYNAVIAFTALHRSTGKAEWLEVARRAADWTLTWRYTYDVGFDPHTILGEYRFSTTGTDQASPANQHLHHFGLLCGPELVELARLTGDDHYRTRAAEALAAWRQFVARRDGDFNAMRGMVTERFYQTDCFRAKGSLLPLSHAWTGGVLLFACLAALEDPDSYAVPD